jgi:8-oxo-dGTP diphosphatase
MPPGYQEGMSDFNEGELRAISILVRRVADHCREDTIGALMYTGAFRQLEDDGHAVVALARKLDAHLPFRRSVSIVAVRDGKVLVVSSRKWGGFSLPGGKIDPGETPEEAARREFLEETGCEVSGLTMLTRIEHAPTAKDPDRNQWDCYCFRGEIGDQQPHQNEEGTVPKWATPAEVRSESLYRELTRSILDLAGL